MTDQQKERLNQLCTQIAIEQDHAKFYHLVKELNELLDEKERRLEGRGRGDVMQEPERKGA